MIARRAARAGETILLRARFLDDLGAVAEADNVFIHIYEPNIEDFDFPSATVVSGITSYLGEGIFQYAYNIPANGPDGIWTDVWEGVLTGQDLEAEFQFEVSASGIVEALPAQLFDNNIVNVTLVSGIRALDYDEDLNPSAYLHEDYEFEFLTTTIPNYSSVRKVRLVIGSLIKQIYDDTVQTAILEASLEADVITFITVDQNTNLFQHARREYVTCLAAKILVSNLINPSGLLKGKTLGDLSVQYDTDALRDALNAIQDCLNRWEPQVMAAGLAISSKQPQGVIKGEYDPDRITPARIWQSTDSGGVSRRMPTANTKVRFPYTRRHLKTWKPRW